MARRNRFPFTTLRSHNVLAFASLFFLSVAALRHLKNADVLMFSWNL